MSLQHCIVILIIAMSVAYVIYRAWKTFSEYSDPCHGCPGCSLKDIKKDMKRGHNIGKIKSIKKGLKPQCESPCEEALPPCQEKKR